MVKLGGGGWIQGWGTCGGSVMVDCQTYMVLYDLGKALAAYRRSMLVFRKPYRILSLGDIFSYRKRLGSIPPSATPDAGDYRSCGEA